MRKQLQARLDGGGLLHLTTLLAIHLAITAVVSMASGGPAGLAVLAVPLIASAIAVTRGGIDHARIALATCWALALVQVGVDALSAA